MIPFIQTIIQPFLAKIGGLFRFPWSESRVNQAPFSMPSEGKKRRRARKPSTGSTSLADLLDHLDQTFVTMKMPRDTASWLDKDSVKALKRLGVYVPHPWEIRWDNIDDIRVDPAREFPALISISFSGKDATKMNEDRDMVYPTTTFAIKHAKLPYHVTQAPGIAYAFGYSFPLNRIKSFWVHCFLVVDEQTGAITVCDELSSESVSLPVRRGKRYANRPSHYIRRQWVKPSILTSDEYGTFQQRKIGLKNLFRAMLDWWRDRDTRWSVGIRKGGDRVVFSVEPSDTKTYFADRDKSVKAADGRAKKIIHYVRGHRRITRGKSTMVKEHIRGLREFDWNDHHCIITAPTFHRTTLTSAFNLASNDIEDMRDLTPDKLALAPRVADMLVDIEERDMRPNR